MALPIGGLASLKIGIKLPQSLYEQALFLLCKKLGVEKFTGLNPQVVPYSIDFSALASPQNIDLSVAQLKNQLGKVKTMFVDNSNDTTSVTITMAVTRQQIVVPGGFQGYIPVASAVDQFQISSSGTSLIGFCFFNVDIPPALWSANPSTQVIGSILFAGSNGVDHSDNAPNYASQTGWAKAITIPANTSRALVGVQNQSAEQIRVWRTSSSTPTVILLESGGIANSGGGYWTSQTYKGAIEIWLQTSTDQFAAYED